MTNKVAIFSDLHLGVHQNSDFWLVDSIKWCKWFVKSLKENKIEDVIFCGDFFHYRDEISVKTLSHARNILDMLSEFNLYMIPGNHDAWYKDSAEINSISILKNNNKINVFDELTTINSQGKIITFCPWGTSLDSIPNSDIIFGHFELKHFKINTYKICDDGYDPYVLAEKAKLVFSGHFHLKDEKQINNSKIIYTGNPFEMDFGDSQSSKGYYILDINNFKYSFIPNPSYTKHIKILLSNLVNIIEVNDFFRNNISNNIIKLVLDKNISTSHLNLLVTKLNAYNPCELRVDYDVNYNKIKTPDSEKDLGNIDIEEAIFEFVNFLDINNKDEVAQYTIELYNRAKR